MPLVENMAEAARRIEPEAGGAGCRHRLVDEVEDDLGACGILPFGQPDAPWRAIRLAADRPAFG